MLKAFFTDMPRKVLLGKWASAKVYLGDPVSGIGG
jgi:hypothetical protein